MRLFQTFIWITIGLLCVLLVAWGLSAGIRACATPQFPAPSVVTHRYVDRDLSAKLKGLTIQSILVGDQITKIIFTNNTTLLVDLYGIPFTSYNSKTPTQEFPGVKGDQVQELTRQEQVWTNQYQRVVKQELEQIHLTTANRVMVFYAKKIVYPYENSIRF